MPIDVRAHLPTNPEDAARSTLTPVMSGLRGSTILAIAGQVRELQSQGQEICNLTVGDFNPAWFPVPEELKNEIGEALRSNQTHYPPAVGIPELRASIARFYSSRMGIEYPADAVVVASGARPVMYATWRLFVEPGDRTVSFLPAWNTGYYAHLTQADHVFVRTTAETNFFPTVEQVVEQLPSARLILLNSPLNPTGTVIAPDVLRGITQAIVDENRRRQGRRPVMLMYDQVYWLITQPGSPHQNPVSLVPEAAPYVIHVDAISKGFAATGLRLGWAVVPPYLKAKMAALIGHMGAWSARPVQHATAKLLDNPSLVDAYLDSLRSKVDDRLSRLYSGIKTMAEQGLPIDAIEPQGGIYLSLNVDMVGRGFDSNEAIRQTLLEEAGLAVVPFQAFDLNEETGWFRMSVGAVGTEEIDRALERMEQTLRRRCR